MTALQSLARCCSSFIVLLMYVMMHDVPSVEVIFQVSDPTTPSHSQLTTVPGQVGAGGLHVQVRLKSANEDKLLVAASRRTQRKMLPHILSLATAK